MRLRFKATHVVLAMLCVMYFITYIDRVNIGTAASEIQKELGLSNTQLGLVFSAFAYPYLLFQVIGGWVGDRFGARRTLFWCGMIWASATIMTGFVHGLLTLFSARVALGFGEGATFPTATRAMQYWTPAARRRARPYPRLRPAGQRGDAAVDCRADGLVHLARLLHRAGIGQPGVGGDLGLVFPQRAQGPSFHHRGRPGLAAAASGQSAAPSAVGTAAAPDVAGHADLFLLWLVLVAVPELAAAVLQEQLQPGYQEFGAVRLGRFLRRRGRRQPRRHPFGLAVPPHRPCALLAAQRHPGPVCRRGLVGRSGTF